jgi:hypothetical protein
MNTSNSVKPIHISREEAIELFCDGSKVNGATFVGIDCVTTEKVNKTIKGQKGEGGKALLNPHFGNVRKYNIGSQVMVFQNKNTNAYENMTKKRMAEAGIDPYNFELGEHAWGKRIPNTPILVKKSDETCKYLEVIFIKSGEISYNFNGEAIAKDGIIGRPNREQGIVPIRAYSWDSIVGFRLDKQSYIVTD